MREGQSPEDYYAELTRSLPTQAAIFLPTERVPLSEKIAGVERVKALYDGRLAAHHLPRLEALCEQYRGRKRAFIIGNGPSLKQTDLSLLKDEVTFCVNGFFLKMPELDWTPTFYVVEDHLVAEDRREAINNLAGPTKLFPAYLRYCLDEADGTIFFNHRPRKSYPHGFDFSEDAAAVTYAGCTVTFTCMQLAHYLGFEELYLIGVDASYALPKDVQESKDYGVGVLDMQSDDPNHFHPDYFGKGYRWHDPQVDKMIEAYREARLVTDASGRPIYNATVGGALEVFERRDFNSLFSGERPAGDGETPTPGSATDKPRLLVIDMTPIGERNATGELKAAYLGDWPADRLMHAFLRNGALCLRQAGGGEMAAGADAALETAIAFGPDAILYRPVDSALQLDALFDAVRRRRGTPYALWLMDDWMERLRLEDGAEHARWESRMNKLAGEAGACFAISEGMAEAFEARYRAPFTVLRNGVRPRDWPPRETADDGERPILIRYAGAIAPHHSRESVLRLAQAVDTLDEDCPARLEINTQPIWRKREAANFTGLDSISISEADMEPQAYRDWLAGADIAAAAYDFDDATRTYLKYSFANKTPELLASGAAALIHGPDDLETVRLFKENALGEVVDTASPAALRRALRRLTRNAALRRDLAGRARDYAFRNLDLDAQKSRFEDRISQLADRSEDGAIGRYCEQAGHVTLREWDLMARLLSEAPPLVVDVGAHYGSSLKPFTDLGWRALAFEPDPKNRKHLERKYGGDDAVEIIPAAVGAEARDSVPIFASPESSGISGLSAFRGSHEEVARVPLTTLDAALAERGAAEVGFLKIDVEGHEMDVLDGLDFQKIRPAAVMVEYEDSKAGESGVTARDLATRLTSAGYHVYVSEWWPIERYGAAHSWRRLRRYPCDIPSAGWGNLLGFIEDPGTDTLARALEQVLITKPAPKPQPQAQPIQAPAASAPQIKNPLKISGAEDRKLVILGGGPQAGEIGLSLFDGADLLAINHPMPQWARSSRWPDYYACFAERMAVRHKAAIEDMVGHAENRGVKRIVLPDALAARAAGQAPQDRVVPLSQLLAHLPPTSEPANARSHVLLWAQEMGYREIYLIGVNRRYPVDPDDGLDDAFEAVKAALNPEVRVINLDWASELPQFPYGDVNAFRQDEMPLTPAETAAAMLANERSAPVMAGGGDPLELARRALAALGEPAGRADVLTATGEAPPPESLEGKSAVIAAPGSPDALHALMPALAARFETVASLTPHADGGIQATRWPHRAASASCVIAARVPWEALIDALEHPALDDAQDSSAGPLISAYRSLRARLG